MSFWWRDRPPFQSTKATAGVVDIEEGPNLKYSSSFGTWTSKLCLSLDILSQVGLTLSLYQPLPPSSSLDTLTLEAECLSPSYVWAEAFRPKLA